MQTQIFHEHRNQYDRGIGDTSEIRPRDVFFAARDDVVKQIVKLQTAHQLQREPRSAELKLIFDTNVRRVDLNPLGLEMAFVTSLRNRWP